MRRLAGVAFVAALTGLTIAPAALAQTTSTTSPSTTTTTAAPTTTTTAPPNPATTTTAPPSTATTAPIANCANAASSAARVSKATLAPGESVTVRGECFAPRAVLTVSVAGTVLGQTDADAFGQFATVLSMPTKITNGSHTLTVTGPGGKGGTHVASVAITISGAKSTSSSGSRSIANSGAFGAAMAGAGLVLLGVGLALRAARGTRPAGRHF
jgi:hypothetical protein